MTAPENLSSLVTPDNARVLLRAASVDLPDEDIERLLPRLARHFEQVQQLRELDLGEGGPGSMPYIHDEGLRR